MRDDLYDAWYAVEWAAHQISQLQERFLHWQRGQPYSFAMETRPGEPDWKCLVAYALLISAVRTEIVSAGFDPSIGIAHRRKWNYIPLVYDLMEPLRPVVDHKVLEFALSNTFAPGDFTINNQGACRLNPQLAKAVASKMVETRFGAATKDILANLAK